MEETKMTDEVIEKLDAEKTAQDKEKLISAVREKLGISIKKVRFYESEIDGENIRYFTAELLPFSREDAKKLNGDGGAELLGEVSELLADIVRGRFDEHVMVGSVASPLSYEDIYRARLYSAFDLSKKAEALCMEYSSNPYIESLSVENATALVVFANSDDMNAFREDGAEQLNAEIVRCLQKADKLGFVRSTELRVILSVK
ncbi:MAG: hypothetical protein ACI4Q4_02565 [Oscillospiraceae bacterium]